MSALEQAIALVPNQPQSYNEWRAACTQAGLNLSGGLLRQIRQSGQVQFAVEVSENGTVTHTVARAS